MLSKQHWECNACADTEGGHLPCKLEFWLGETVKPIDMEYCPQTGDECDWYEVEGE